MRDSCVVVGGGVAGLSCASYLAKAGFKVTLFEKNEQLGGKLGQFKVKGFTFDSGPSWYLMPEVFERFFGDFGHRVSDYYALKRLNSLFQIFFSDGDQRLICQDKLATAFRQLEGDNQKVNEYFKEAAKYYQIALDKILYNPSVGLSTFLDRDFGPFLANLISSPSLEKFNEKYFNNQRIRELVGFGAMFLGAQARQLPFFYSLINHVIFAGGIFYPMGGMYQITSALEKQAKDLGVEIRLGEEVEKIVVKNREAKGVKVKGRVFESDVVISNADYKLTEEQLLEVGSRSFDQSYWSSRISAPRMLLIYIGLDKRLKRLEHHNIFLGEFSYYVCVASKTDKTVEPGGCENLFILVQLSNDSNPSQVKLKVIEDLEARIGRKMSDRIVFEKVDLIDSLGLAHTFFQSMFLRPSNKSRVVANLYYTGANTQPGIGVPMCLISGKLTAQQVIKSYQND